MILVGVLWDQQLLVSEFFYLLPLVKASSTQFMICGAVLISWASCPFFICHVGWYIQILVLFTCSFFFSQREIPSSNIDLHSAHCARNLQKCEHCGEMVARKLMDEHYNESHAPVCSKPHHKSWVLGFQNIIPYLWFAWDASISVLSVYLS